MDSNIHIFENKIPPSHTIDNLSSDLNNLNKIFQNPDLIFTDKEKIYLKNINQTSSLAFNAWDSYTKWHSIRVSILSANFVSFLGLPQKEHEEIQKAGLLHDIGKICLSASLLHKPYPLTKEEADEMKKHVIIGEEICKPFFSKGNILSAIRNHHERWDGNGFPDGLFGKDIPFIARILSIVDSFDAMVSERSYRNGKSVKESIEIMKKEQYKGQWDPELVGYFIKMMT